MASRSTARAVTKLAQSTKAHVRRLSMTGPATYPSAILTESKQDSGREQSSLSSTKRPQPSSNGTAGSETSTAAAAVRQFNTSRSLKAVKDNSTIDFAYFPTDIDPHDDAAAKKDVPFSVPVLLSTMYSGVNARAMHEEETESTLRPLIELVAASGTHISMPSAMSEVHDNNAVEFEGIASTAEQQQNDDDGGAAASGAAQVGEMRQLFNDILDDVFGPKRVA